MQSFAEALPLFLKELQDERISLLFLGELWPQIVGSELAQRTRPVGLDSGRLLLQIPDPLWEGQVRQLRSIMIRSINEYWGKDLVKQIEMEPGY